jgi:hypothetical protein
MALDLDGFAALRKIAANPKTFPAAAVEARKAARTLVLKQLRDKETQVEDLREIRKLLGREQFSLMVDGMPDATVKSLVTKFDRHNPESRGATPDWRRQHLVALAAGTSNPAPKPIPAKKASRKTAGTAVKKAASKQRKESPTGIWGSAMAAVRKR